MSWGTWWGLDRVCEVSRAVVEAEADSLRFRVEEVKSISSFLKLLQALTNRKIHEASEMEPKTPDRASCVVRCRCGLLCASVAVQDMAAGWRLCDKGENLLLAEEMRSGAR